MLIAYIQSCMSIYIRQPQLVKSSNVDAKASYAEVSIGLFSLIFQAGIFKDVLWMNNGS